LSGTTTKKLNINHFCVFFQIQLPCSRLALSARVKAASRLPSMTSMTRPDQLLFPARADMCQLKVQLNESKTDAHAFLTEQKTLKCVLATIKISVTAAPFLRQTTFSSHCLLLFLDFCVDATFEVIKL
jgi:hypothetical protein